LLHIASRVAFIVDVALFAIERSEFRWREVPIPRNNGVTSAGAD